MLFFPFSRLFFGRLKNFFKKMSILLQGFCFSNVIIYEGQNISAVFKELLRCPHCYDKTYNFPSFYVDNRYNC